MKIEMELADVLTRMLEIEAAQDKEDGSAPDPYGVVAAKLLGLPHSNEFDDALRDESTRAYRIAQDASIRYGIPLGPSSLAAVALVQGITLAAAAQQLRDEAGES